MEDQVKGHDAYRWLMLSGASISLACGYMNLMALAPILNQIAQSLGVSMAKATDLMSGFHLAAAISLLFTGIVCDKCGIGCCLIMALSLSTLPATCVLWVGHSYELLLCLRVIQGVAVGFALVLVGPVTASWFPKNEQGLAGGLMMGSMTAGLALGALIAPLLLRATESWQQTMALFSIFGWAGMAWSAIVLWRVWRRREGHQGNIEPKPLEDSLSLKGALSSTVTWVGALVLFFNTWSIQTFFALVPSYLAAPSPMGIGLGSVVSGRLSSIVLIVSTVSMMVGGLFLDRVAKGNYRVVLGTGFVITALFTWPTIFPIFYESLPVLGACLILAGSGNPFGASAFNTFVVATYPRNMVGRVLGFMTSFSKFGSAMGIYVGGTLVAKTGSFRSVIVMVSVTALMAMLLTLLLKQRKQWTSVWKEGK